MQVEERCKGCYKLCIAGAEAHTGTRHDRVGLWSAFLLQVNKLKGERYKLIWKDSPDFVRLASKLDCTIIPFAAVGGE